MILTENSYSLAMYTLCSSSVVFERQTRKPFNEVGNSLNSICDATELWFNEDSEIWLPPSIEIHSNTIF